MKSIGVVERNPEVTLYQQFHQLSTEVPDYLLKIGQEKWLNGKTVQAVQEELKHLEASVPPRGELSSLTGGLLAVGLLFVILCFTPMTKAMIGILTVAGLVFVFIGWYISVNERSNRRLELSDQIRSIEVDIDAFYDMVSLLDPLCASEAKPLDKTRLTKSAILAQLEDYAWCATDKLAELEKVRFDSQQDLHCLAVKIEAWKKACISFYHYWWHIRFWEEKEYLQVAYSEDLEEFVKFYWDNLPQNLITNNTVFN